MTVTNSGISRVYEPDNALSRCRREGIARYLSELNNTQELQRSNNANFSSVIVDKKLSQSISSIQKPKLKLFILEDSLIVQKSLELALGSHIHCDITVADSLSSAQLYLNKVFDVLIFDIRLEDGLSFNYIEAYKNHHPYGSYLAIMHSSHYTLDDIRECNKLDLEHRIKKGMSGLSEIQQLIEKQKSQVM